MNKKQWVLYWLMWFTPSSTAFFIILSTWANINIISSYLLSCVFGGLLFLPLNKYIFKNKCEPITIIINGMKYKVNDNDVFMVWETSIRQVKEHG